MSLSNFKLREELALYPGISDSSGSPTWTLHDPVRNLFFRIDWLTFELLNRWHINAPEQIISSVVAETTLTPDLDDLKEVSKFLDQNHLIQRSGVGDSEVFVRNTKLKKQSWYKWLLHHYLFFRVPLIKPDHFLTQTLPWVKPLLSKKFLYITFFAFVFGLIEVSRQWDVFASSLIDTLSWQGLLSYALTLIFVKFFHELGHAYTAKRFGCRIPTMGVAFLVMFPVAYTDMNDAYKLSEKKQKIALDGAGILTELLIAAWATFFWALLPEGNLRAAAFLLATTTWISTVFINSSPFMRFDGYYLLADWMDLPNLHHRSFNLCRWWLRELLFGLKAPPPEYFNKNTRRFLIVFSLVTWGYRFVVFGGIAALVYYWFSKPLGPMLAAVEIGWFILLPIIDELKQWSKLMPEILRAKRFLLILLIFFAFLFVGGASWNTSIHAQAMLKPQQSYPIIANEKMLLKKLPVQNGQFVKKGTVLAIFESPDDDQQRNIALSRAENLEWQLGAAGVNQKFREERQVNQEELGKLQEELNGIDSADKRHHPVAPFNGLFFLNQPDLAIGSWTSAHEQIATLLDIDNWKVEAYLSESAISRVKVNDSAKFYSETPGGPILALKVTLIDKDATRVLPEPILASTHGGMLLVREKNKNMTPEKALFKVTLQPVGSYKPDVVQTLRGQLIIQGTPAAPLRDFLRSLLATFYREAGF